MSRKSLGLIETLGLIPAIEAADAASKAANVIFLGQEITREGLVTVRFAGDVAAVQAAVTSGLTAAQRVGHVVSSHVIPRPDDQLSFALSGRTLSDDTQEDASRSRARPQQKAQDTETVGDDPVQGELQPSSESQTAVDHDQEASEEDDSQPGDTQDKKTMLPKDSQEEETPEQDKPETDPTKSQKTKKTSSKAQKK